MHTFKICNWLSHFKIQLVSMSIVCFEMKSSSPAFPNERVGKLACIVKNFNNWTYVNCCDKWKSQYSHLHPLVYPSTSRKYYACAFLLVFCMHASFSWKCSMKTIQTFVFDIQEWTNLLRESAATPRSILSRVSLEGEIKGWNWFGERASSYSFQTHHFYKTQCILEWIS